MLVLRLFSSNVLPRFASGFMGLDTVADIWAHLRQRYQSSRDVLYLSMVHQEHDPR